LRLLWATEILTPLQQAENKPGQLEASPGAAADRISGSSISPDVATIISEIMDHTERQEETVALGPQEIPSSGDFPGARGYAFLKANSHLKIQSLPILDNLVSLRDHNTCLPGTHSNLLVYSNPLLPR
jgi:hypothetical protein